MHTLEKIQVAGTLENFSRRMRNKHTRKNSPGIHAVN